MEKRCFFDYKALDQELRKHLPCVFDIAVFCMSIYQWIVSPKQPKTSGWLFVFLFFVFNRCFSTHVYLCFPTTSVHRIVSPCVLFNEPGQLQYETHGLTRHPTWLDYFFKDARVPNKSRSSDSCAIRSIIILHL